MRYYKVYRFYDPGDGENGPRLEDTLAGRFDTLEEAQAFAGESSRIKETDTDDKDPMELIAYLYSFMDDEEKTDWHGKPLRTWLPTSAAMKSPTVSPRASTTQKTFTTPSRSSLRRTRTTESFEIKEGGTSHEEDHAPEYH